MTTITLYKCDICGEKYSTPDEAMSCENKGIFDVKKFPSIGTMFEYHHNGYVGIFCLASVEPNVRKHYGRTSMWAARTSNYPPGVGYGGELMCGGYEYNTSDKEYVSNWISNNIITKDKINTKEFKRMVEYLKSQKIIPKYYNKSGKLITIN